MLPLQRIIRFDLCRLSTAACVSRQIFLPFCFMKKMNASQKPISSNSVLITAQKPFGNESPAEETRQSSLGGKINEKQFQSSNEIDFPSLSVNAGSSSKGTNFGKWRKRTGSGSELRQEAVNSSELEGIASQQEEGGTGIDLELQTRPRLVNSSYHEGIVSMQESGYNGVVDVASPLVENYFPSHFGKKKVYRKNFEESNNAVDTKSSECSEGLPKHERFNICLPRLRDIKTQEILRPGMVLLKHYISLRDQIDIVETCNSLGEGPGGFYRPGYKDGAKLRLHMMCLGMNWDPQTRKYDKRHPVDNCEPPEIPLGFRLLVQRAIKDAHCLIKKDSDMVNPEDILPSMSPNVCIVNFYSIYGRLGLHQDRDESRESIRRGLPVVSLSIGDSAEFLYGDGREIDQAKKVLLESGDVLLFGGKSRMVFHGVPSIVPSSAPEPLKMKTGLRHGRLNLTFRQF
ncbi:2-oxoglutarate-dependent dioxygenase family protein isoform 2 [Hibiscus syriacus]|uniref:2-oxoglutarate-dependent dioxygenase family protein isoform 2 n=1 Tax=Hibiscus syriacus TaxID=106335 RepID=A0A6A2WPY1_HIBSY|nr:uncharacterized protein LOC120185629 [Hibiscus syriacus]KAE8662763.1 2-oxoglutarate-dependent dioxygenase family protein isoform 2 [Hibiscus syriacus]